jgi:hypothetical protein
LRAGFPPRHRRRRRFPCRRSPQAWRQRAGSCGTAGGVPHRRRTGRTLAICAIAHPAAAAKDTGSVKEAEQSFKDEDPNTVLIKLKIAIRKSPQDPAIRVNYSKGVPAAGGPASAEREARTARDLKGDEADYLPVLIDALLPQKKFKDLYNLIEPGDRNPFLESKVRVALGTAALRLGYDTRAEALLCDAVLLDPGRHRTKS